MTITGSNLAAAVTVSIGGTAATGVSVSGSTITATTGSHAAGIVDVVVTSNGQTGRLTGAYSYKAPTPTTNTPPVIKSIAAKGTRPNEPAQFADLDDEIAITATVEDAETPISQLTFEWTAPTGTLTGQGASVTWKAPAQFTTPAPVTISLVVTEKYQTVDDNGLPVVEREQGHVELHGAAARLRERGRRDGAAVPARLLGFVAVAVIRPAKLHARRAPGQTTS